MTMVFRVPDELYAQPLLCCKGCGHPVPNDKLDLANAGMLGPCPVCGSEELIDNPNAAMTYSKSQEYPGLIGLVGTHPALDFARFAYYTPKIDTERKKRKHPIQQLLEIALGAD